MIGLPNPPQGKLCVYWSLSVAKSGNSNKCSFILGYALVRAKVACSDSFIGVAYLKVNYYWSGNCLPGLFCHPCLWIALSAADELCSLHYNNVTHYSSQCMWLISASMANVDPDTCLLYFRRPAISSIQYQLLNNVELTQARPNYRLVIELALM